MTCSGVQRCTKTQETSIIRNNVATARTLTALMPRKQVVFAYTPSAKQKALGDSWRYSERYRAPCMHIRAELACTAKNVFYGAFRRNAECIASAASAVRCFAFNSSPARPTEMINPVARATSRVPLREGGNRRKGVGPRAYPLGRRAAVPSSGFL
jgi:hypothetical protein